MFIRCPKLEKKYDNKSHQSVKVGLLSSHLDHAGIALGHLSGVGAQIVEANNLIKIICAIKQ